MVSASNGDRSDFVPKLTHLAMSQGISIDSELVAAKPNRLFHDLAQIRLGEWFPKQRKATPVAFPTRQQEDLDSRSETSRSLR
jgi:hypothetical protein